MPWTNTTPEATDVICTINPCCDRLVSIEVDKLTEGGRSVFRATIGNLFDSNELGRTADLERMLRILRPVWEADTEKRAAQAVETARTLLQAYRPTTEGVTQ